VPATNVEDRRAWYCLVEETQDHHVVGHLGDGVERLVGPALRTAGNEAELQAWESAGEGSLGHRRGQLGCCRRPGRVVLRTARRNKGVRRRT
jgi:hypothetical protein